MRNLASAFLILLAFTACTGGDSDSGGGSGQGPTSHAGRWTLKAVITAIVGGVTHNIDTTTNVNVLSSGAVGIIETDTECALSIYANGDTFYYKEVCVLEGSGGEGSDNVPCTLELEARAQIVSPTHGSGIFGPKEFVCVGLATSYSGTLLATRDAPVEEQGGAAVAAP